LPSHDGADLKRKTLQDSCFPVWRGEAWIAPTAMLADSRRAVRAGL